MKDDPVVKVYVIKAFDMSTWSSFIPLVLRKEKDARAYCKRMMSKSKTVRYTFEAVLCVANIMDLDKERNANKSRKPSTRKKQ